MIQLSAGLPEDRIAQRVFRGTNWNVIYARIKTRFYENAEMIDRENIPGAREAGRKYHACNREMTPTI
jgi:hypothetical protein